MTKVAFVTGGSSGFGRGFALGLAREGYRVAVVARRRASLDDVADEIRAGGGSALVCCCDVTDPDKVREAIARTEAEFGPVDLLIANAGASAMTRPEQLDASDVVALMSVNFFGVLYAVEGVLPSMLERGRGHIVAIGSLAGYGGLPLTAAYSASKGALHNFMESLRVDLRRTGVDVTMITPGYVHSEFTAKNKHSMPLVVELDDAVARMLRAIHARKRHYMFPWQLATLVWMGQVFPSAVYDWVVSRHRRDKHE